MWIFLGLSGCSLVQKSPIATLYYEVHVKGNHADGDKDLLKESCHEITPAAAKARSACFVPRAHYEMQTNQDFTLTRWSLIRVCS